MKKEEKILQKIINSVVEIAHPDKIILFGSRATGKAKKDSDYDILVLKKNIKKILNVLAVAGLMVSFGTASALTISPARAEVTGDPGEMLTESFLIINDQDVCGRQVRGAGRLRHGVQVIGESTCRGLVFAFISSMASMVMSAGLKTTKNSLPSTAWRIALL